MKNLAIKRFVSALLGVLVLASTVLAAWPAAADSSNLLANPSVSNATNGLPTSWTASRWGSNDAQLLYDTTAGHNDSTSLLVTATTFTSGDAKWAADSVSVTPNHSYTYSDWYTSTVPTELDAQYIDNNGNTTYAYVMSLAASSSWQQATATFITPANVARLTVLHIIYSAGSLHTDDFTLVPTVVAAPATGGNLIANASFATANAGTPAGWTLGHWGSNNGIGLYNTNLGHSDLTSATVSISQYTSGDVKWAADPVLVTPGTRYTYNDWYQSTVTTQVVVAYISASGQYSYVGLNAAAASGSWMQYDTSFTVPSGIAKVQILHLLASAGTLTIDDASLQTAPSTTNLVLNPSVETNASGSTTLPASWQHNKWGTNSSTFTYAKTGHTGTRSISVNTTKYTSGDAKWYFNSVPVTADAQYRFSDWYKATTATEIDVAFDMDNGSTLYSIIGLPEASDSTWAQFSTTFSAPLGAHSMSVYHLLHSVGSLSIDDVRLETTKLSGFSSAVISLTFDDGYDNIYTQGLPLLQKYDFLSTQFIITGNIGLPGYMSLDQMKAFSAAGHEMASHTVTHTNLLTETPSQWQSELSQSKSQLTQWLNLPVVDLAYPNGLYNAGVIAQAKLSYTAARGVESGFNSKDNWTPYALKAQDITSTTTTAQVADWVAQAQATKTWLILVYHAVNPDTSAGEFNVTPLQLDSQLAAIKASGVNVMTMQQAFSTVSAQL